jgi:AcrR family transcriptional regulator
MRTRNAVKEQLVKREAMKIIVRDGLDGFTVNKLAKQCKISVATLYIYYKDKDDLIMKIAREETERVRNLILTNFDPELSFRDGMKVQWENRSGMMLDDVLAGQFLETLRGSNYGQKIFEKLTNDFRDVMGRFMKNAVARGEIDQLPLEVFWSMAFAPLYTLVNFHSQGKSLGFKPFMLTDKVLWQTFELVMKALKK